MYINFLLLTRQMIIAWIAFSLAPTEFIFDTIEDELVHHGYDTH